MSLGRAVKALLERDPDQIREVFQNEPSINQCEIEIDKEGHECLALGQPMAADLRLVTMILKINTNLERMGDHAFNIAERAQALLREPALEVYLQIPQMARETLCMVEDALESFQTGDVDLARSVLRRDDTVDAYNDGLYNELEAVLLPKNPAIIKAGMNLVMVGHNLERIADLANNIAEDVIYLKEGKEVRHHTEKTSSGQS